MIRVVAGIAFGVCCGAGLIHLIIFAKCVGRRGLRIEAYKEATVALLNAALAGCILSRLI